jgi:hypothetical protein
MNHKKCSFDSFFARSKEVNSVCCATDNMCTNGMPKHCAMTCAQAYLPFFQECINILKELMNGAIKQFQGLDDSCSKNSKPDIWHALAGLQNDGCTWNSKSLSIVGSDQKLNPGKVSPGGHRRRNQGLDFSHHPSLTNKKCPHTKFKARVDAVDAICCMDKGVNICKNGQLPKTCTVECGIQYRDFFLDCSSWIKLVMDDEYTEFKKLYDQCEAHDAHELLDAMLHATCTVPAASCAEYDALAPLAQSGVTGLRSADGIEFDTHCLRAQEAGITGHPFTRFWHYKGGKSALTCVMPLVMRPYPSCITQVRAPHFPRM